MMTITAFDDVFHYLYTLIIMTVLPNNQTRSTTYYLLILLLLFSCGLRSAHSPTMATAQENDSIDAVTQNIFNQLSPEERVGQLFMISFTGMNVSPETKTGQLIQNYRLGGVYLSARNRNFINDNRTTPIQLLTLNNALQELTQTAPPLTNTLEAEPSITTTQTTQPIPLFIAVDHEGDGYPFTHIRGGFTELPNQMTIGATWNPSYAEQVGAITGRELSLVGINMIFGPVLDVLDNPRPDLSGSLGTRTFGGDPYWVANLGQAYIRGLHVGSDNQLLTIAKHFPGFGSSDRELNKGVPTILKSLNDIRNNELYPFAQVTQLDQIAEGMTDGLMTAHIRYQGLLGNVPISLDARNLPALLALQEFAPWRQAGGLVVSAPLGSPAALEGITTDGQNFPARRLVQDAILAGNDLLLLDNFAFEDQTDSEINNIVDAVTFTLEQYNRNASFRTVVDRAVQRIIKAKIRLYGPDLFKTNAFSSPNNLDELEQSNIELDHISQDAITLIMPQTSQSVSPLPNAPETTDTILIFTDEREGQDCIACRTFNDIDKNILQTTLLDLFGPTATGQLTPEQINSFSYAELKEILQAKEANPIQQQLIQDADWMIFAMQTIDTQTAPNSDALRLLLRTQYDIIRNKNLVVFAFNAPYFLDETEISQLTAYYTFYSKGYVNIELAARLLFQQFQPIGASPVSIPAIGALNLNPDPTQILQLSAVQKIDTTGAEQTVSTNSSVDLKVGESVLLRTNKIVDRNGHAVPDGTRVDFFRVYPLEGLALEPLTTETVDGVAEMLIVKERDTPLRVTVSSNLAVQSEPFDIGPGILDTPTPTPTPTNSPTPTGTIPPTTTPTASPTPVDTPTIIPALTIALTATPTIFPTIDNNKSVTPTSLIFAIFGSIVVGSIGFVLGGERFSLEERIRPALVAIACGLASYSIYASLGNLEYNNLLIEQGRLNEGIAPLISTIIATICMGIWFIKPGRLSKGEENSQEEV